MIGWWTVADFGWFTSGKLTCDWQCHRARGSRGGEDRYHPPGSPARAPYDAVVTYGMYGDGASYVQFKYSNGYAHQAIHVQADGRVPHGSRVAAGTVCALSDGRRGTFGAGTSTGPHFHFQGHAPDGTRIPWQDVPAPTVQLAGVTIRPFLTDTDEQLTEEVIMAMPMLIRDPAGSIFIIDEKGSKHLGDPDIKTDDINTAELIEAATMMYGEPVLVNERQRDVIFAIANRRAGS